MGKESFTFMTRSECDAGEIYAIAHRMKDKVPKAVAMAERAISLGLDSNAFRQQILDNLPQATAVQPTLDPARAIGSRELSQYSISRAVRGIINGRLDGLESEINAEMAMQLGRSAEGFWVPWESLQRNAVAGTGTLGGYAVSTPNLGSEFIKLRRNTPRIFELGARRIPLPSPVTIPRQSAAGTVNWAASETAASTLTGITFEQVTLTPKCMSVWQQYSKQLLVTSNPAIDSLINEDIVATLALELDRAALHGSGGAQPTGIASTAGITTVAFGASGGSFTTANALGVFSSLEAAAAADNADDQAFAFLVNAKTRAKLKTISKTGTDSEMVWEKGNTILNYRTAVSNQIATNLTKGTATTLCSAIFAGAWDQLLVGVFNNGAVDLVIDPYSLSSNAVVRVIAHQWVDTAVRRPSEFAVVLDLIN